MNMQALALAFLAATAIGGLAWVFLYPLSVGGEKGRESPRLGRQSRSRPRVRSTRTSARAASRSKDR